MKDVLYRVVDQVIQNGKIPTSWEGTLTTLIPRKVGEEKILESIRPICLIIGGAKCGLIASNERDVQSFLRLQRLLARFAAAPSFQACLRALYVHFVCVCAYMCMCVCVQTSIYVYIYACVYVFVHLCVYTHVYVYVYAYLCIDCESWYQCFSVWTVSCMRVCVRVHMYAYAHVCRYIYMCIFLQ